MAEQERRAFARSGPLILGLWACLLAGLAMALVLEGRVNTWQWKPLVTEPMTVAVEVAADRPDSLEAQVPCSAVTKVAAQEGDQGQTTLVSVLGPKPIDLQFTRGSLVIAFDGQVSSGVPVASLNVAEPNCAVRLVYQDTSQTIALQVPGAVQSVVLGPLATEDRDAFVVMGYRMDFNVAGQTSVTMTTRPATIAWQWWRWLLFGGVVGCVALAFLILTRGRSQRLANKSSERWTISDTLVAIAASFALFFVLPLSDDGYVITRIRNYESLGFFSNYYTARAAPLPQGFWWEWLEQLWVKPSGMPILFMRLPSLILFLAAWWLIRRRILDQLFIDQDRRLARVAGCALALVALVAWNPSLRAESIVAVLLVAQFLLIGRFHQTKDWSLFLLMGVVAALALSAHQTGWAVLTAALAVVPDVFALVRRDAVGNLPRVMGISLLSVALLAGLLSLHSNAAVFAWAGESFNEGGKHSLIFNEWARVQAFMGGVAPVRTLSAVLIVVTAVGFLLFGLKAGRSNADSRGVAKALGAGALFSFLGLALTSSKWIWHIAAVWPSVVLLGAMCSVSLVAVHRKRWVSPVAALVLLAVGLLAQLEPGAWGVMTMSTRSLRKGYPPLWLSPETLWFWLLLGIPVIYLVAHRMRSKADTQLAMEQYLVPATTVAVCGLTIVVSCTPLIQDAVNRPDASWPRVVASSVLPDRCGLAGPGGLEVPLVTKQLANSPTQGNFDLRYPFGPLGDARLNSFFRRPVESTSFNAAVGRPGGSTQWFSVVELPMRSWMFPPADRAAKTKVQWRDARGELLSSEDKSTVTANAWSLIELNPPARATSVRFQWDAATAPISILAPVQVESAAPLTKFIGKRPVWQPPYTVPWASCLQSPNIDSGLVQDYEWIMAMPEQVNLWSRGAVNTLSEQACLPVGAESRYCVYRVNQIPEFGVTESFSTRRW